MESLKMYLNSNKNRDQSLNALLYFFLWLIINYFLLLLKLLCEIEIIPKIV